MLRFREQTTETAGFYNTPSVSTTTRALSYRSLLDTMSCAAVDCGFLARLVAEHRLDESDAASIAADLA